MLKTLRLALFRNAYRRTLTAQKRRRKTHTLESAHTIGILFDATEEKDRREVLELAEQLESKRKKARLLGFVDIKKPLGQTLFPQFTQKDLRFNGVPDGEAIKAFVAENFDLLICLNPEHVPALQWIAAASHAAMKIGTATTAQANDFDLVVETPADKGIRFFIQQLDLYLDKIVLTKYEPATAL